jgi:hypothetical protein
VDDRIDAVTRGMLGLTVSCARCHDHKYDPVPTKDYYSLYSVFSNIRAPKELPLLEKSVALAPRQKIYEQRLANIQKVYQEYRLRRNAEMVAFFKTQIADYLIAARDAGKLSSAEIEDLVRDRQLNLHVLSRWRKYLSDSQASGEPVFLLWHAAAAAPRAAPPRGGNRIILAAVETKPVSSLRDLAERYAAVLMQHDRPEPFSDAAAEQLRAVMRGPASPVDVPLDQFELPLFPCPLQHDARGIGLQWCAGAGDGGREHRRSGSFLHLSARESQQPRCPRVAAFFVVSRRER